MLGWLVVCCLWTEGPVAIDQMSPPHLCLSVDWHFIRGRKCGPVSSSSESVISFMGLTSPNSQSEMRGLKAHSVVRKPLPMWWKVRQQSKTCLLYGHVGIACVRVCVHVWCVCVCMHAGVRLCVRVWGRLLANDFSVAPLPSVISLGHILLPGKEQDFPFFMTWEMTSST